MLYHDIINAFSAKRLQLGISDQAIADRAGLSQPTVNRILSGRYGSARLDQVLAIADVLGMRLDLSDVTGADRMRYEQAVNVARGLSDMTQATMALEGQGLSAEEQSSAVEREVHHLLAGPGRKLWSD